MAPHIQQSRQPRGIRPKCPPFRPGLLSQLNSILVLNKYSRHYNVQRKFFERTNSHQPRKLECVSSPNPRHISTRV
ncbi:hypothetical protein RSAG8_08919, partial [Rhizoctonia solani AG-8 WAC10335]